MKKITRIFPKNVPDTNFGKYQFHANFWRKTRWIAAPGWDHHSPVVWAFRKTFTLSAETTFRICVTADQRYDLYLDGERIAFGSDRGLSNTWFFETLELTLDAGTHTFVSRVWWSGTDSISHYGHTAVFPGFLLHGCGEWDEELSTRSGNWEAMELKGYTQIPLVDPDEQVGGFVCIGGQTQLDLRKMPEGWAKGEGTGWRPVLEVAQTDFRMQGDECIPEHLLVPGILPAMQETVCGLGEARFATVIDGVVRKVDEPVFRAHNDASLQARFQKLSNGEAPMEIPAHTLVEALFDIGDYVTAWPLVRFHGGRDALIKFSWAESLMHDKNGWEKDKRDRNEIEGKYFYGFTERCFSNGADNQLFDTLWFQSGRYVRLLVETQDEPLTLASVSLRVTHYPESWAFSFRSDDRRWDAALPVLKRTLTMCSHESYFDCPYYEQLMYGGDTRLEILTTYATCADDRLPRKAILLFDRSRSEAGLTLSRVPSRIKQIIPPFSLYWVQMVYDYSMMRNDPAFVRDRMDGIRSVLLAFHRHVDEDGLLHCPLGWNFIDWVNGWDGGHRPNAEPGLVNGIINFHYVWVLRQAAALESVFGQTAFAAWARAEADRIAAAARKAFWDEKRHLFADDLEHKWFSEHAQCMAICGGSVPEEWLEPLGDALASDPALDRATIYYNFYLLEAFRILKRPDELYKRFQLWLDLPSKGFRTTPEKPDPTRSDCHAWGSHPLYHLLTSVAGIRPAAPGFSLVRIEPQPGPLRQVRVSMPHPAGSVGVDIALAEDGKWHGKVQTPDGIPGILAINGEERSWNGGALSF